MPTEDAVSALVVTKKPAAPFASVFTKVTSQEKTKKLLDMVTALSGINRMPDCYLFYADDTVVDAWWFEEVISASADLNRSDGCIKWEVKFENEKAFIRDSECSWFEPESRVNKAYKHWLVERALLNAKFD